MSVLFALLVLSLRRGQVSRLLSAPRHANVIDGANFALEVPAVCVCPNYVEEWQCSRLAIDKLSERASELLLSLFHGLC